MFNVQQYFERPTLKKPSRNSENEKINIVKNSFETNT